MVFERQVFVFWDASVVPAANSNGIEAVKSVFGAVTALGRIRSARYYADARREDATALRKLHRELQSAGVTVVNTTSECSGGASKMSIADALVHALDSPPSPNHTILFVSADADICYGLSLLRMRGYQAYLLAPSSSSINAAEFQPSGGFDGTALRTSLGFSVHNSTLNLSHSPGPNPFPSEKFKANPSFDGRGDPSPTLTTTTKILPPQEINDFRRRFSVSRPSLDTGLANPFRPHRHSFSSFGRNDTLDAHTHVPPLPPAPLEKQDVTKLDKGKGRATFSDSSSPTPSRDGTPLILSAATISSRSNSFDSNMVPPSASTAPTSAFPLFLRDEDDKKSKLLAPSTYTIEGLLESPPATSDLQQELNDSLNMVERAMSTSTDGSGTATITVERPASRGLHIPEVSVLDVGQPSTGEPPALTPERIQVRPSPLVSYTSTPSPDNATVVRMASPMPAPVGTHSYHPPSGLLPETPPVASTSTLARTHHTRTRLAPHFQTLVNVLRDNPTVGRGSLYQYLEARQPNILHSAGTLSLKRPLGVFLEQAFAAGIITSPSGRVKLSEKYT